MEARAGLRIDFQDVTRRGFEESDIQLLCDLMMDVIKGRREPSKVKEDVIALRHGFRRIEYGFQSINKAVEYSKKLS